MVKSYSATGKISQAKLKKLLKGQNVTLKGDGDNDIDLEFNSLKDYNRYVRAMSSGKGFVVNHNKMKDIFHSGGSIKSINRAFKKAGNDIQSGLKKAGIKNVIKEVAKNALKGSAMVASALTTGDPTMGSVMMSDALADKATSKMGLGIKSDLKKFGRNRDVKKFARGARKAVKQIGRELAPVAKQMGREVVNQMKADASEKLRNDYIPQALNVIDKHAGSSYGDIVANSAHNALVSQGMGLKSTMNKAKRAILGGALHAEAESSFGLGGARLGKSPFIQGMDAKQRMAYVRSHRKVGGSFKPL